MELLPQLFPNYMGYTVATRQLWRTMVYCNFWRKVTFGGFEIQDLLAKKKVSLNIPPFMRCKDQLSPEKDETRDVASVRIHVERAIEGVKKLQHFDPDHS